MHHPHINPVAIIRLHPHGPPHRLLHHLRLLTPHRHLPPIAPPPREIDPPIDPLLSLRAAPRRAHTPDGSGNGNVIGIDEAVARAEEGFHDIGVAAHVDGEDEVCCFGSEADAGGAGPLGAVGGVFALPGGERGGVVVGVAREHGGHGAGVVFVDGVEEALLGGFAGGGGDPVDRGVATDEDLEEEGFVGVPGAVEEAGGDLGGGVAGQEAEAAVGRDFAGGRLVFRFVHVEGDEAVVGAEAEDEVM